MGNHGQKNSKHESVLQSCPSLSHSTVDALGVCETMYMVKKAETFFWTRVRLLYKDSVGCLVYLLWNSSKCSLRNSQPWFAKTQRVTLNRTCWVLTCPIYLQFFRKKAVQIWLQYLIKCHKKKVFRALKVSKWEGLRVLNPSKLEGFRTLKPSNLAVGF